MTMLDTVPGDDREPYTTQLQPSLTLLCEGSTIPERTPSRAGWGMLALVDGDPETVLRSDAIPSGQRTRDIVLMDQFYRFGRQQDKCQFVLSDMRVSSAHFTLEKLGTSRDQEEGSPACAGIKDTSTNGTFINGTRLVRGVLRQLDFGDRISLVDLGESDSGREGPRFLYSFVYSPPQGIRGGTSAVSSPSRNVGIDGQPKTLEYRKGELIARGGFGSVHLGLSPETGEFIAVKTVRVEPTATEPVTKEIELLQQLPQHQHIVRYLGWARGGEPGTLDILLEWVSGGSLARLYEKFGPLRERLVAKYLTHILAGLDFLHSHGVIHQDVKAANVLVTIRCVCKLTDFGSALRVRREPKKGAVQSPPQAHVGMQVAGTPPWMSPEMICGRVGVASDIWATGCTVLEMVTAKHPWSERQFDNPYTAFFVISTEKAGPLLPPPGEISDELRELLQCCLMQDPDKRAGSAKELMRHSFFTKRRPPVGRSLGSESPAKRRRMLGEETPVQPTHAEVPAATPASPPVSIDLNNCGDASMATSFDSGITPPPGSPTGEERQMFDFLRTQDRARSGAFLQLRQSVNPAETDLAEADRALCGPPPPLGGVKRSRDGDDVALSSGNTEPAASTGSTNTSGISGAFSRLRTS
eukprot:Hpha_TRINITY_DN8741_c0_g2::TRINITY_DN8741_c0_g2_i1::g.45439::m.45439